MTWDGTMSTLNQLLRNLDLSYRIWPEGVIIISDVYLLNFSLCLVIIILGYWVYRLTDDAIALYIVSAFGLFGLSHLAGLIGLLKNYSTLFSIIRTLGYVLVIFALIREALLQKGKPY